MSQERKIYQSHMNPNYNNPSQQQGQYNQYGLQKSHQDDKIHKSVLNSKYQNPSHQHGYYNSSAYPIYGDSYGHHHHGHQHGHHHSQIYQSNYPQHYQAYRGESRLHSYPIERREIEYAQVPVEKTYIDQEVIEYQTEYIPRIEYDTYVEQVPVKSIEYVPVQRIDYVPQERIDYVPQQRQVERVEYDIREVPVSRGVQQSQIALNQSQIGQPQLTNSQIRYQAYPLYGQECNQSYYTSAYQPTHHGHQQPQYGSQVYGKSANQEYVKKDQVVETVKK